MNMVLATCEDLVRGNHVFAFILYDPSELKPQGLVCNPTRDKQTGTSTCLQIGGKNP